MTPEMTLPDNGWHDLQRAQFSHDENFHREISRLNTQDRLKHMVLHFAKYAGSLQDSPNEELRKRIIVDTFIIAVSTSNILNVRLDERMEAYKIESNRKFERRLSVAAGKMAAACEKLDHLEDFPFKQELTVQALEILAAVLDESVRIQLDVKAEVEKRLSFIKSKSLFYKDLIN